MGVERSSEQYQLVVFEVGSESFGIDISLVQEIIRLQPITEVPKAPMYVKGVINLRGKVIPVVDLRERFGFAVNEETKATRIVVVNVLGNTVGMIVDAVSEVLRLSSDAIEPPSTIIESVGSQYLKGIGKVEDRLVMLLDLSKLLVEMGATPINEMEDLSQVA
ncbi:MAG: chemotaxis protein CheW [Actinomycetota bacterium]|nr:chemotaxis protein CheW [Actinomycetota bacterium]